MRHASLVESGSDFGLGIRRFDTGHGSGKRGKYEQPRFVEQND
jgi:hypothetical protein